MSRRLKTSLTVTSGVNAISDQHSLSALVNGGYIWTVQDTVNRSVAADTVSGGFGISDTDDQWKNQDIVHAVTYRSSVPAERRVQAIRSLPRTAW